MAHSAKIRGGSPIACLNAPRLDVIREETPSLQPVFGVSKPD